MLALLYSALDGCLEKWYPQSQWQFNSWWLTYNTTPWWCNLERDAQWPLMALSLSLSFIPTHTHAHTLSLFPVCVCAYVCHSQYVNLLSLMKIIKNRKMCRNLHKHICLLSHKWNIMCKWWSPVDSQNVISVSPPQCDLAYRRPTGNTVIKDKQLSQYFMISRQQWQCKFYLYNEWHNENRWS